MLFMGTMRAYTSTKTMNTIKHVAVSLPLNATKSCGLLMPRISVTSPMMTARDPQMVWTALTFAGVILSRSCGLKNDTNPFTQLSSEKINAIKPEIRIDTLVTTL